ncbi:ABC transporter ATP-binding protein [Paenirhodobacter populi]|nr:ABC transporter ATP-binding protein [Sinirhodobacter populi]
MVVFGLSGRCHPVHIDRFQSAGRRHPRPDGPAPERPLMKLQPSAQNRPATAGPMSTTPVLSIRGLSLEFPVWQGALHALEDVTIEINAGEIVGIVGESGCGKSVTAMATMRLLPEAAYKVTSGALSLLGHDMLAATETELRHIRGSGAAMIFQEPLTALNPTRRIGTLMTEVIRAHRKIGKKEAQAHAVKLLKSMRIADAEAVMNRYSFELSGGMRQRIVIALAFANDPKIVIADEPTTALDVTVQRQVLTLLQNRARDVGAAVMLITHDLGVVSEYTDRVYVMYAGKVVETGPTASVLTKPCHPYTHALLAAGPDQVAPGEALASIPGTLPDLREDIPGCRFADRCAYAQELCRTTPPPMRQDAGGQSYACWIEEEAQA